MSCTLYHLLLASLAALMLGGCTTPGGAMNWGPFQRRTDTADTIPLSNGTSAAAPSQPASSSSWAPSWNPFGSSSEKSATVKNTSGAKIDANPNLEAYQLSVGSRLAKGRELERAGQFERARGIYLELIKQYPRSAEPYHRMGIVADKQHRYREAQEHFIQSLQLDPRNANVRVDLGYCFYMQGQIAQAEAETRAALQIAPRDERAHNNLGLILGAQDRMAEAFEHFRLGGSEADAQFNMAFCYASRNNLDAAKECFQRALDIDPNHEKARKALDSFVTYENQPDEIRTAMELAFQAEHRGTIPFVEPGTVLKASAEGETDASTSAPRSSVVPAMGAPGVSHPRQASKAIHSLYNEARAQKPLNSQGE
jgi:tetratricopeptide (TPR) repeat protein